MFTERPRALRVSVAVVATAALAVGALAVGLLATNRRAQRKARAAPMGAGEAERSQGWMRARARGGGNAFDYGDRSGWPEPAAQMRGRARADANLPRDMQTPPALRPLTPRV